MGEALGSEEGGETAWGGNLRGASLADFARGGAETRPTHSIGSSEASTPRSRKKDVSLLPSSKTLREALPPGEAESSVPFKERKNERTSPIDPAPRYLRSFRLLERMCLLPVPLLEDVPAIEDVDVPALNALLLRQHLLDLDHFLLPQSQGRKSDLPETWSSQMERFGGRERDMVESRGMSTESDEEVGVEEGEEGGGLAALGLAVLSWIPSENWVQR